MEQRELELFSSVEMETYTDQAEELDIESDIEDTESIVCEVTPALSGVTLGRPPRCPLPETVELGEPVLCLDHYTFVAGEVTHHMEDLGIYPEIKRYPNNNLSKEGFIQKKPSVGNDALNPSRFFSFDHRSRENIVSLLDNIESKDAFSTCHFLYILNNWEINGNCGTDYRYCLDFWQSCAYIFQDLKIAAGSTPKQNFSCIVEHSTIEAYKTAAQSFNQSSNAGIVPGSLCFMKRCIVPTINTETASPELTYLPDVDLARSHDNYIFYSNEKKQEILKDLFTKHREGFSIVVGIHKDNFWKTLEQIGQIITYSHHQIIWFDVDQYSFEYMGRMRDIHDFLTKMTKVREYLDCENISLLRKNLASFVRGDSFQKQMKIAIVLILINGYDVEQTMHYPEKLLRMPDEFKNSMSRQEEDTFWVDFLVICVFTGRRVNIVQENVLYNPHRVLEYVVQMSHKDERLFSFLPKLGLKIPMMEDYKSYLRNKKYTRKDAEDYLLKALLCLVTSGYPQVTKDGQIDPESEIDDEAFEELSTLQYIDSTSTSWENQNEEMCLKYMFHRCTGKGWGEHPTVCNVLHTKSIYFLLSFAKHDGRFKNLHDLIRKMRPTQSEKAFNVFEELSLWSVLTHNYEMVRKCWDFLPQTIDRISISLFAAGVFRNCINQRVLESSLFSISIEDLKRESNLLEDKALDCINKVYVKDKSRDYSLTTSILKTENTKFGGNSAMVLAQYAKADRFLAHSACEVAIDKDWKDKLYGNNWWRLLLVVFFPPFAFCFSKAIQERPASVFTVYSIPVVKYITSLISYLVFVTLYSIHIMTLLDNKVHVIDYILILWVFAFLMDEIHQLAACIKKHGVRKITVYFSGFWNIQDILAILLFTLGTVLRWIQSCSSCLEVARIVLAFDIIIFYVRILHFFELHRELGPLMVMMKKMIFHDLFQFIGILVLVLTGYGVALHSILYPNSPQRWSLIKDIFTTPYFEIYGELFLEQLSGEAKCEPNRMITNTELPPCPSKVGSILAPVMLSIYILITNVLLLNLLIAMFSNTYATIQADPTVHSVMYMQELQEEFKQKSALPPPLVILNCIIWPFRFLRRCNKCHNTICPSKCSRCCKKKRKGLTGPKAKCQRKTHPTEPDRQIGHTEEANKILKNDTLDMGEIKNTDERYKIILKKIFDRIEKGELKITNKMNELNREIVSVRVSIQNLEALLFQQDI